MNKLRIGAAIALLVMGAILWSGCSKKTKPAPAEQGQEATQPVMKAAPRHVVPAPRVAETPATTPTQPATAPAAASEPASAPVSTAIPPAPPEARTPQMTDMEGKFGLIVLTVTAKDKAIEVIFQAVDPEKSGQILSPDAQRYLVDQKSGTKLSVPYASPRPGRERRRMPAIRPVIGSVSGQRGYVVTFDNSQGLVLPGDKVTLIMDEYEVPDLTVR